MSFNRVETTLLHISIRSLMTVAGMGGIVVLFIEGGTGRFSRPWTSWHRPLNFFKA